MTRLFSLLFALAVFLASAASPDVRAQEIEPLPSVELPAALERVLRDYERHWTAGEADSLAMLFTNDGFVMSPGRPPVRGRGAIAERYTGAGGRLILRALAYDTSGSTGYIIGAYAYPPGDRDMGKFILALRRDASGRWLIAADMDNENNRSN